MTAPGDAWSDAALTKALARRAPVEASAQLFIRHASTGAKPILAVADNGKSYWLKWPDNPHGNLSLAHEMIVAKVGQLIDAPVRPAALVHVDPALVEDYYIGGERPVAGTYFASELLHDVEEHTTITRCARRQLPSFSLLPCTLGPLSGHRPTTSLPPHGASSGLVHRPRPMVRQP
jgi:hypothetical protein